MAVSDQWFVESTTENSYRPDGETIEKKLIALYHVLSIETT